MRDEIGAPSVFNWSLSSMHVAGTKYIWLGGSKRASEVLCFELRMLHIAS